MTREKNSLLIHAAHITQKKQTNKQNENSSKWWLKILAYLASSTENDKFAEK